MYKHIAIRKSHKKNAVSFFADFFAELLGLTEYDFTLIVMTDSSLKKETAADAVTYRELTEESAMVIRVDSSLRVFDLAKVMAHEMIHVKQHIVGDLFYCEKARPFWKGELCENVPYSERPWEVEAYRDMVGLLAKLAAKMTEK